MSHGDELKKLAPQFDSNYQAQNKGAGWWLTAGAVLAFLLGVGVMQWWYGASSPPPQQTTVPSAVEINRVIDGMALILFNPGQTASRIELSTTTPQTTTIQKISPLGQGRFLAADLAPDKARIAAVREENGHRDIIIIDVNRTSLPSVLEKDILYRAANGRQMEPCAQTPIVWSPNGKRLGLLGCAQQSAVIVIVEVDNRLPVVLKNTESQMVELRQLFWLDNSTMLYNIYNSRTKQNIINFIEAQPDAIPIPVVQE